jgi:hypothetical protein
MIRDSTFVATFNVVGVSIGLNVAPTFNIPWSRRCAPFCALPS